MAHVLNHSCVTRSFFRFVEQIKSFPGLGRMRSFCTNLIGNAEGIYHIRWRPLKPAIEALSTKRLSLMQFKLVVVVVWTSRVCKEKSAGSSYNSLKTHKRCVLPARAVRACYI